MTVIKASTKLREHSDDSWLSPFTELDNKFTQFFKIDSLSIRNLFFLQINSFVGVEII